MLTIFTIVLNGMPFIERHLAEFQKLKIPWRWRIVEGVSEPVGCTRWCKQVPDKWHKDYKSIDGTHEYLNSIQGGNVVVYSQGKPFNGKLEMIQNALYGVDSGVVMEVDADEMWRAEQIEGIYECLKGAEDGATMQFHCNFFVGENKRVVTREGYGSNWYEWMRAWKWGKDVCFTSHEPPRLNIQSRLVPRGVTETWGLVFDHYAYAIQKQVEFKEDFYGYKGLVDGWKELQKTIGPVRLSQYFPHLHDKSVADDC
jgi:hypothetical protein